MSKHTPRPDRELFDRLSATAMLIACLPILLIRAALAWRKSGRVLDQQIFLDTAGKRIALHRFAGISKGRDLARLLDIAAGRLAWEGPAPIPVNLKTDALSASDNDAEQSLENHEAYTLRCGLVSVWRLQRLTGSQYEGSDEAF